MGSLSRGIDIPLEVRFHADKENRRKSFKVAVGGKFGVRYDVHNKIKYEESDITKKVKNHENYNVPNFRYGLYGRLGIAGIHFYYYYSLTEFFDNKKGPDETQANTMMIGLSWILIALEISFSFFNKGFYSLFIII